MARRPLLDFEKPLVELEQQIEQIRQLARDSEVDVSQQLLQLETLAARRRDEIFRSLTPAQKIQVARHPPQSLALRNPPDGSDIGGTAAVSLGPT